MLLFKPSPLSDQQLDDGESCNDTRFCRTSSRFSVHIAGLKLPSQLIWLCFVNNAVPGSRVGAGNAVEVVFSASVTGEEWLVYLDYLIDMEAWTVDQLDEDMPSRYCVDATVPASLTALLGRCIFPICMGQHSV